MKSKIKIWVIMWVKKRWDLDNKTKSEHELRRQCECYILWLFLWYKIIKKRRIGLFRLNFLRPNLLNGITHSESPWILLPWLPGCPHDEAPP